MQIVEALVEFQGPVKGQEGAAPDMSGGLARLPVGVPLHERF